MLLTHQYTSERGWFARQSKILIVGEVFLPENASKAIVDETMCEWFSRRGWSVQEEHEAAVICYGAHGADRVIRPVSFDFEDASTLYVCTGGAFRDRWGWNDGYRANILGLGDHPLRVLDGFDDEPVMVPIVPDQT
jgi:hypothetical protein